MLPEAPPDPTDVPPVQVLIDGDLCDTRSCGARAYARVYMYVDGDKDNLAGVLHWCGHHWRPLLDTFWLLSVAGKCSYLDETGWILR
jgi:hypothetical protein